MISDVLFEAGQEIDRYLLDVSHVCAKEVRTRLVALRTEIDAIRALLGQPPIVPTPEGGAPEPALEWEPNEFENAAPETGESDAADHEYLRDDTVPFTGR
jgi:hypothetical protein